MSEVNKIRPVDLLTNLKNHDFDISNYPLCKKEADLVIDILMTCIEVKEEKE